MNILIFAFTCWGDEGRGELEDTWGFRTIISAKDRSSFGDLVGSGKDRKMRVDPDVPLRQSYGLLHSGMGTH